MGALPENIEPFRSHRGPPRGVDRKSARPNLREGKASYIGRGNRSRPAAMPPVLRRLIHRRDTPYARCGSVRAGDSTLLRFRSSFLGAVLCSSCVDQCRLAAGDGHAVDAEGGGGGGGAEDEVVADGGDVLVHVLQVAGDGDLFNRVGELAVLNPEIGRASCRERV